MISRLFIFFCFLLLSISCNKDEETGSSEKPLIGFRINMDPDFHTGLKSWIVFSNPEGEIIEISDITDSVSHTVYMRPGPVFHATHIYYSKYLDIEPDGSMREFIYLKTYAFLDGEVTTLNLKAPVPFTELEDSAKTLTVHMNVLESRIKESLISGTLTGARNTIRVEGLKVLEGRETVFNFVHLKGEDNWRIKFLDNVEDGSFHWIELEEMEEIPIRKVQVPDFYDVDFDVTGIIDCEEDHAHLLQWYSPAENGIIESRYLPEGNDLFPHYRTNIRLQHQNKKYQYIRVGTPIDQYEPTEIDFSVTDENFDNFQMTTASSPYTLYEIKYSHKDFNHAEWLVYSTMEDTFVAPDLTEILKSDVPWFHKSLLTLNEVKEYHFSEFTGYNDWLRYEFDPDPSLKVCSRDKLNFGEEATIRSLMFE